MSNSPSLQQIKQLAKQGNSQAIAILLNRDLRSQGITVQVKRRENILLIRLLSNSPPAAIPTIRWIRLNLQKLSVQGIQELQIQAKVHDADQPVWRKAVKLSGDRPKSPSPRLPKSQTSKTNSFQKLPQKTIAQKFSSQTVRNPFDEEVTSSPAVSEEKPDLVNPFDEPLAEPTTLTNPFAEISATPLPANESTSWRLPTVETKNWPSLWQEWVTINGLCYLIISWIMLSQVDKVFFVIISAVGVAYLQTCVLARRLSNPWHWGVATALGTLLPFGMVFSGIAQWIVLRKVIPNASRWLYVHLGVGIISLILFLFRGSLNSGGNLLAADHIATSLSWGLYIAATTTALQYLLGHLPEELTPPTPNFLLSVKAFLLRPTFPFAVRTGRSLAPVSQSTSVNSHQNQASARGESWDERLIEGAGKLIARAIAAIKNVFS